MTGAAGLFGAALSLIYLWMAAASPDRLRSAAKTGSVLALALAAVLGGAPGVAVAGLCAAAMGDLALSRAGERAFRIGVLWFCLAQILFVVGFGVDVSVALGVDTGRPWPLLILLALGGIVALALGSGGALTRGFVGLYVPLLLGMGWMALASGVIWWSVGAALFILSDALIALSLFDRVPARVKRGLAYAVWTTYWPAVACLTAGFLQV
ncbi:lysoplasmalogenase family protein [Rhodophyticola porphyridii]|uniref:lysoplasmalogenase family protein n=1 Tax=Rhodophyticola porphyridii TaxID=1852017 RepID=UPI0035CE947B